jgi:phosphonate transport system substrate-binding protein
VAVPTSYAAVVEGITSNNIDIAWVGALAYVAAHQKSGAEVLTKSARCAPTYDAKGPQAPCDAVPSYPSIVVCSTASNVPKLQDGGDWSSLKGKKFAFGDPDSTSSNLWPHYYLKKNKIADSDFSKTTNISSQGAIALAVLNGTADCGAMFGDARLTVAKQNPNIFDRTQVAFIAPQAIPGDPQLVRKTLNAAQKSRVRSAMEKLGHDASMKPALDKLYQIASMEPAQDSDFDPVRTVVNEVNPGVLGTITATPSPASGTSPGGAPGPTAAPTR